MIEVEIFFDDLTEEAKERLLLELETSPEYENWETQPLFVYSREADDLV